VGSNCTIHPTAIVAPEAQIGRGTTIGAYSIVGPHVVIGEGNKIGPHVVIEGYTTIGSENTIFQFASVGSAPQDLKYRGEASTLVVGDKNIIREYVTLQPGTAGGEMMTVIGNQNLFMVSSHVAHDCRVGDRNVFANSVAVAGHVEIGNGVILGGLCGIHQFVKIGDLSMLAGGSMINRDVPPYCMVQGNRAYLVGLNLVGLERNGLSNAEVRDLKLIYQRLFKENGVLRDKLVELENEYTHFKFASKLFEFIRASQRGVTRAQSKRSSE
jgi:UDP-N-acetylglucosamine acyltransferase